MTDQLTIEDIVTLDNLDPDLGPSYDRMIARLEEEALEDARLDDEANVDPEFRTLPPRVDRDHMAELEASRWAQ